MIDLKGYRKTGRCYRRVMRRHKDRRLRKIILGDNWYNPYRGYIDYGFVDGVWQPTGNHVKYLKNSNRQRYLKKVSNRRVRRCSDIPAKGNRYRRVFDYWSNLD